MAVLVLLTALTLCVRHGVVVVTRTRGPRRRWLVLIPGTTAAGGPTVNGERQTQPHRRRRAETGVPVGALLLVLALAAGVGIAAAQAVSSDQDRDRVPDRCAVRRVVAVA
jgi:hypothetical protein